MFIDLGDSFLTCFISEWLTMEDVYLLDMAYTSHQERDYFLSVLKTLKHIDMECCESSANFDDDPLDEEHFFFAKSSDCSFNYLMWLANREINIPLKIWLSFDDYYDIVLLSHFSNKNQFFTRVISLCLHFAGDSREISTRISGYFQKALSVFCNAAISVCMYGVQPACVRKLLEFTHTERIVFINMTFDPLTLQNIDLLTNFLRRFGSRITWLGNDFLSRFQNNFSLLPLVSQHCSQLIELPYGIYWHELDAWWDQISKLRSLKKLRLLRNNSRNLLISRTMLEIVTTFRLLQTVELENSIDMVNIPQDMANIITVFQNCRQLRFVRANDWFAWAAFCLDAKSEARSIMKPSLLIRYPWADEILDHGHDIPPLLALHFTDFFEGFCSYIPCNLERFVMTHKGHASTFSAAATEDYFECVEAAFRFLVSEPCKAVTELELGKLPLVFKGNDTFPNVKSLKLLDGMQFQTFKQVGDNLIRLFPNVTRLSLQSLSTERISYVLGQLRSISELEIHCTAPLISEDFIRVLVDSKRVWNAIKFSVFGGSCALSEKEMEAQFELLTQPIKDERLLVKFLQYDSSFGSTNLSNSFSRKLGRGRVCIKIC